LAEREAGRIKSVIHFRRIMEAYQISEGKVREAVVQRLTQYILEKELETRKAFDEFVVDNRRILGAIGACEEFVRQLDRLKIDFTLDRNEIKTALEMVRGYVQKLLDKLEGSDQPPEDNEEE